jgi:hypothetical protein
VASDSLAVNPAILPNEIGTALESQASYGTGGSLLPATVFASGCGHLGLYNPVGSISGVGTGPTKTGITTSFSAGALSPSDLAVYATVGGGALVVFTVQEQENTNPPAAGDSITWTPTSSWERLLPAGNYGSVSLIDDQQIAIAVPSVKHDAPGAVHIVGASYGIVSVSGTPAP